MMPNKFLFIILISAVMLGCNRDPELEYGFLDERLAPHFSMFELEANKRGYSPNLSSEVIEAFIQNVYPNSVAGQCQRNDNRPSQIIIDEEVWNSSTEIEREFLIFHELGHCILGRTHLDSAHPDGRCISIMHSVLGVCRNEYETRRSEYLDELFK